MSRTDTIADLRREPARPPEAAGQRRTPVTARPAALLRERRLQVVRDPGSGQYRITLG